MTLRRTVTFLVMFIAIAASGTARAQLAPPEASSPPVASLAYPDIHASLFAPPQATTETGKYPFLIVGARIGSFFLKDKDVEDVYGVLPILGLDAKIHLGALPLAVQTSFDWAFGEGELDENTTISDSDADITLYGWRVSALLEPSRGILGTPAGTFYLTPYVGVGVGLHWVDWDFSADTTLGEIGNSANDQIVGYHAIGGIDLVFKKAVSVGVEVLYTTAEVDSLEDEAEEVDIGGFAGTITFRLHF